MLRASRARCGLLEWHAPLPVDGQSALDRGNPECYEPGVKHMIDCCLGEDSASGR
jgi:hypothetical protein